MLRYILQKTGQALFVIWATYTAIFVLLYVLPSDPVELLYSPDELQVISDQELAERRAYYGFDQGLLAQYVNRVAALVSGDMGDSITLGVPVWQAIFQVLPNTIVLAVSALALAVLIAVTVSVAAVVTRSRALANLIAAIPPAAVSVPSFLIGLGILQLFSYQLGWFSSFGNDGIASLILPTVTLAIPVSGPIAQVLLKNLSVEFEKPYVVTSITKGASRAEVLLRDVLRNAGLPAITLAGVTFGNLIAGAVITETIFSRTGIGRLTQTAVSTQDVPLLQGIIVFVAFFYVLINLIVDILYPLLDPRIQREVVAGARARSSAAKAEVPA